MTLRVVPGSTVDRTTTSWRVGFDRIASPISVDTASMAARPSAPFRRLGVPTHTRDMSVLLTASVTSAVAVRCPLSTVALDDLIDLALDDGRSTRADQIDLGRRLVDADDRVPAVGETGRANGSHIAKSEHTDPHSCFLRLFLALTGPAASRVAAAIRGARRKAAGEWASRISSDARGARRAWHRR